jgi:hypothetical protein
MHTLRTRECVTEKGVGRCTPNFNLKYVNGKLSLCLTNKALLHEDVWGSGCIDPRILDFVTSWW